MTDHEDLFQQAMNQGHSAAWDQNWERAAGFYRIALKEFPKNPQALTSLGLALIELQEYDEALRCYQKAARFIPEDPLPLEKIAQLCERMGNLEIAAQASLRAAELYLKNHDAQKAIENWERVARLDPENLQAHSRLALVYERLGEKSKAAGEYLAAAGALQSAGSLDKAREAVEQALKIQPGGQEAKQYLGLLKDFKPLPKTTRPRGATAPLRMSQVRRLQTAQNSQNPVQPEMDPVSLASQKALTALAGMLFEIEEDVDAASERKGLQAIVTGTSGATSKTQDRTRLMLHLSQLVDLQARGEYTQAADELQRALDIGLEHPAASFDLGFLYAQVGRLESASRHLLSAVKSADYALGARMLLGDLLMKKGKFGEAAIEFLQALKLADVQLAPIEQASELSQLYELLIESHREQNDPTVQERWCENIHGMLARGDWRAQLQRARQQLPKTSGKGPLIPLGEVLTEARSSQVIESVSTIYEMVETGLFDSAMEEAYFTLQLAPTYLPMHALMGDMLVKNGDYERAVAKYQVLARAYEARNEMNQAIQYSRKVIELAPTDLTARSKLIEQLLASGQIENAMDEYAQLAEAYYNLADRATARKTYMEALKAAQQTNADRVLKIKLLHRVADIDMQSMEWRQALRILDQIRTLQPDDEEARWRIVDLSLRMGQEPTALAELDNFIDYMNSTNQQKKLVPFLERLSKEFPEKIPLRRRLVDAYASGGQIPEATGQLDLIGETLLQSGDRAGAIQTIERIISLSPPNKEEYITLLSKMRNEQN